MELSDLVGVGASLLTGGAGGLVGLVGGIIQKMVGAYEKKKDLEREIELARINSAHELQMADKRIAEIEAEAKNALALAEVNRQKETDVAALSAMETAHQSDRATFAVGENAGSGWMIFVDVVRGLTRPVAFWILLWAVLAMTWWCWKQIPDTLLTDKAFLSATFYRLVDSVIFLATAAGCFWFVTRPAATKSAG